MEKRIPTAGIIINKPKTIVKGNNVAGQTINVLPNPGQQASPDKTPAGKR